jgi:hypothetical protein
MDDVTRPAGVRRTTIEAFNDEMAVLDRPLEHEIEYIDDKPASRWARLVPALAAIGVLVGAGYVLGMRVIGGPLPWPHLAMARVESAAVAPPAAVLPAAIPAMAPIPAPPAPAVEPAAPVAVAEEADAPPEKDAAPARASHRAWSRVGHHHKKAHRR